MRALLVLLSLWAAPCLAAAQCVLSGDAAIDAVTPRGTELTFGIAEEARVTIDGSRARVEGIRPIAFVGSAASGDVHVFTGAERTAGGVASIAAGTRVQVNRVRGARVASFVDAGAVRMPLALPCDALALTPPPPDAASEAASMEDDDDARPLLVRGRRLQVFAGPTTERGVRLALRPGTPVSEWPWFTAHGAAGTRIHVRSILSEDVTVDGWVERGDVHHTDVLTGSCCDMGGVAGCGHGFAGESYRGPARLSAGTELTDGDGRVWGRVVEASDALVVISTITVTTRASGEEPTVHRTDTVWIEGIPGLVPDPCSALGVQVDRASIALPTDPN